MVYICCRSELCSPHFDRPKLHQILAIMNSKFYHHLYKINPLCKTRAQCQRTTIKHVFVATKITSLLRFSDITRRFMTSQRVRGDQLLAQCPQRDEECRALCGVVEEAQARAELELLRDSSAVCHHPKPSHTLQSSATVGRCVAAKLASLKRNMKRV